MVSSCVRLSASAYTEQHVVIAIKEGFLSSWITQDTFASEPMLYYPEEPRTVCTRYMNTSEIADFNPSQETFEFGDIIEYENVVTYDLIEWGGTLNTDMYALNMYEQDQSYSIHKVGSIFDNPETKQFTVTGHYGSAVFLKDDDGNHYNYLYDWLTERDYYQPDCVDVSALHSGDVINCITYNGIPMTLTEITSVAPPSGDASGDGALDIVDVILVNKAILGKKSLNIDQIYHTDFNQDGVPDSADSLTMLKMIVGLE